MGSLLMAFCDAMVQVSADGTVASDATRLSAMLFRQPLSGSMQGSSFLDLVHAEDQPRLLAALEQTGPCEPTGTLAVRLLDVRKDLVDVQMYFSCFMDFQGLRQYLVGICESHETFRAPDHLRPLETAAEEARLRWAQTNPSLCSSAKSVSSSNLSGELVPLGPEDDVSVYFDVFSENFSIEKVS